MELKDKDYPLVDNSESFNNEEIESLHIKMVGADRQMLDCSCRPISSTGQSVTYACNYEIAGAEGEKVNSKSSAAGRVQGKFSMNLP